MSKMGNEMERLLDENKYDMYYALSDIRDGLDDDHELIGYGREMKLREVLAKIENNKGGE